MPVGGVADRTVLEHGDARDGREVLVIGEPYWVDPPPQEAYDAIGCEPEEFLSLAGLVERFEAAGQTSWRWCSPMEPAGVTFCSLLAGRTWPTSVATSVGVSSYSGLRS